mmetsp:Transcript_1301/g.3544  ORF Transcript_1301/g.3544 Transcript_1301/m.3544 type:complete len:105 (-) Transcript_1301:8-322(-)
MLRLHHQRWKTQSQLQTEPKPNDEEDHAFATNMEVLIISTCINKNSTESQAYSKSPSAYSKVFKSIEMIKIRILSVASNALMVMSEATFLKYCAVIDRCLRQIW